MKVLVDEGKKKATLRLTKVGDFDNSVLEKAFSFYKCRPRLDDIDVELHPLISEMWTKNYRTFNCCCGHKKVMGFIMFLPPKKRMLRGAWWKPNEPIPQRITELKHVETAIIIIARGDAIQPFVARINKETLNESQN